ncbi:diguanylate cyclase, partial [Candidatus Zixiibacteriota bacterium]
INNNINANLAIEEISKMLLEELGAETGCHGCAVLAVDKNEYRILAEKNAMCWFDDGNYDVETPGIKHFVETRKSFVTGDITNGPAAGWVPADCAVKSLLRTPILIDDIVRGIIHLDAPCEDAFAEEDVRFVELMAQEMSIAMKQAALKGKVRELSTQDDLTGCLNRRKLDQDIEMEIARAKRYEREISVLLVDILWIQESGENEGFTQSDGFLKQIVDAYKRTVRSTDVFYRYAGKKIAILLPETGKEKAMYVARRLQKIIGKESLGGKRGKFSKKQVSTQIGIASYPWDGNSREQLLRSVDAALHRARSSGRNKVYVHDRVSARSWTS